jgi:hypothetical protein
MHADSISYAPYSLLGERASDGIAGSRRTRETYKLPNKEIIVRKFICGIAIFVFLHCAAFAETTQAGQHGSSFGLYELAPLYSEAGTTSQYLTMRDGVRLAVSITRPSQNARPVAGRFPVLWQHALAIAAPGILTSRTAGAMRNGYGGVPTLKGKISNLYTIIQTGGY